MKLSRLPETAVRVVGIIPLRVVEMVPVVEIVPVRVVEIVPVLVVEIVPPFEKATVDIAKSNATEQKVHFSVFMIFSMMRYVKIRVGFRFTASHSTDLFQTNYVTADSQESCQSKTRIEITCKC